MTSEEFFEFIVLRFGQYRYNLDFITFAHLADLFRKHVTIEMFNL